MEYNINRITDYLATLTGCQVKEPALQSTGAGRLPLSITSAYNLYDVEFMGTPITIAVPRDPDDVSPMRLAKHQAKMMDALRRVVVFALESVPSYALARLTRARVNFIVAGKVISIPSMLTVLRELKNPAKPAPAMMPPVAQLLVLYHLEKQSIEGLSAAEIAALVGLAYPTINVALRWLKANNLINLVGSKRKQVKIAVNKRALWDKALSLMSSPVERTLFADTRPTGCLPSGETAMGHYTLLAEPTTPIVAIDKTTAKAIAASLNKDYGDVKVEVWKYTPALLAETGVVDRLSLYLSLKDSEDERTQIECDTLINEIKW